MFLFLSPLTFFGLPLFLFLFLCLSLSLVFLSSFLSFFLLSFCFLFLSLFMFLSSLLLFHEKNNMNIFNRNLFFSWNVFSFFWCPVLLFLSNPFFLSLLFPDFKLCFLFNINVFGFKKQSWETPLFGQKGSCNKTGFLWTCVLENVKSYRFFWPIFLPNFGWCSKNTIKIGISAHFKKQNVEKMHFEVLLSGPSRCYYLGQVDCNLKMANLAQIITPQICARNFFFKKKRCWNPCFYSGLWQTVFCTKQTWPR